VLYARSMPHARFRLHHSLMHAMTWSNALPVLVPCMLFQHLQSI